MISRQQIVDSAREWIGTPFHHQGYLKRVGCDCIGLVCGVALELGIQEAKEWAANPLMHQYGRPPQPRFLVEACNRYLDKVEPENKRLADILIMTFEKEPMHFALISNLDPLHVIHSLFLEGRAVEHRIDDLWQGRIRMCYGYRGIK